MLAKTIFFEDFDSGEEVSEVHHFHIYKGELAEFNISFGEGGLEARFAALMASGDKPAILELFKSLIDLAYGKRDPADPRKFAKTPELLAEFKSSPAYDALYTELMLSEHAGVEFLLGSIPKSMSSSPEVIKGIAEVYAGNTASAPAASTPAPASTPVQNVNLPDDSAAWPADNGPQPFDKASYLTNPRDEDGNLFPWAFREPSSQELTSMPRPQMMDVFRRKNTDWQPFEFKTR